ncbi:AAA ATPase-like protein [Kineothrix alysoides]|uniref:AAA ATPase-like protein n=1 Tax=Kineothrix alysoides TaxID=1469948 RepID=A0A4V2QCF2_9FIRM|nr:AAA family ATPase [Kineothrix alysoides]TCL60037.1 AAA ATPase-like protein [Kineothrix alysoides]
MQIQYLKINGFKALKDFEIHFNARETGDSLVVLIGENGAGKSTVLEVILRIFGAFYSGKVSNEYRFDFEIIYIHAAKRVNMVCISKNYEVKVLENSQVIFDESGSLNVIKKKLKNEQLRIVPLRIVTFYSGVNNKFSSIVDTLEKSYAKSWREDVINHLKFIYSERPVENERGHSSYSRYDKRFIHCKDDLVPIYLISLLCGIDSSCKNFLKDELIISENLKIKIELNVKKWKNLADDSSERHLKKVLSVISFVMDNFENKEKFMDDFYHNTSKTSLNDKFLISIDDTSLFNAPQSLIYNFLERISALFDAKVKVTINGVDIMDFSEGQLQLIKIFGMLSICKNEECLVLLDEPDAHMNPKWKYYIRDYVQKAVSGAVNTQIILATHDPLVINGMPKEDIKIFGKNNESNIQVFDPNNDTMGMGIDGLLQSEYYRLKTSYDQKTSDKYQERQRLYIKLINKEITDEEKIKLKTLTKEIGALPVSNNTIDFLYDDFMSVFRQSEFYNKEYLEFDQIEERRRKIKEIISTLYEEIR